MSLVISVIRTVVSLYSLAFVARFLLTMVLGAYHPIVVFLYRITEPVLAPIRRRIPTIRRGGMVWDPSPVVAILLLWVIGQILVLVLVSIR